MSCIYFTSREGTARLKGSEREWLRQVAHRIGATAWDINPRHLDDFGISRALTLMDMLGTSAPDYLRSAVAAIRAETGSYNLEARRRFLESILLALHADGLTITIDGFEPLRTRDIQLNTALALGSPQVQLAAKINGWCESFAWFDGPDRAWAANIIQDGLDTGLYRRGIPNADWNIDNEARWHSQGWDDVQALLRANADSPVVMSYSGSERFPEPGDSDWDRPTPDNEDDWDDYHEAWSALPETTQFDLGMSWLRRERPWAQITPGNLATETFGYGVTIYDLYAPDRDERIRAAIEREEA
jgi:hypothetical protein